MAGMTLRGLVDQAGRLGFMSRAARIEPEDLDKVALPAVLHWRRNHFVVLRSLTRTGAVLHDPARGEVHITRDSLARGFTGVILELEPGQEFVPGSAGRALRLRDLGAGVRGLRNAIFVVLGLSLVLLATTFAVPFHVQLIVDDAVTRGDYSMVVVLGCAFAVLLFFQAGVEVFRGWALQATAYSALFQVVSGLVRHMTRLPLSWFEARNVGDILSRVASANAIQDTLARGVVGALLDGLMLAVAGVLLLVYSPILASIVFAGVGVNGMIICAAFGPMRRRMQDKITASAAEQSYMMETVRAAATIKFMGREADRVGSWQTHYGRVVSALTSIGRYHVGMSASQTLVNGLQLVIILSVGALLVMADEGFSVGMLVAFLAFRQIFSDRATTFVNQVVEFRFLKLHLERLGDIVQSAPETPLHAVYPDVATTGRISLRGVGFRYGYSDRDILSEIDLEIHPGEYIAITGISGGGKSTFLKLLLGLLEPTAGHIELEGAPANAERWRSWRSGVGFVSQDDRLLAGSIAENIAFFDVQMDMRRVRQVAEKVGIDAEIMRMPMQYMTRVGDMGSALSSGQKQRLFLARALYNEPAMLVLDEGTANLDASAELVVADLVASLPITRIIVAHRPALIARAERQLELSNGRLFVRHQASALIA